MIDQDPLDDAIDRTVRDMTHVAADDDGVARVMARLRESRGREVRAFTPRLAWAGAAAVLFVVIATMYSLRAPAPDTRAPHLAERAPAPSTVSEAVSSPPRQPKTVPETPTPAVRAASRVHATTVTRDARDVEQEAALESDIVIASITPAPLGDAPAIHVAPLITSSLTVDAIPVPSIDMPPVSPEQQR